MSFSAISARSLLAIAVGCVAVAVVAGCGSKSNNDQPSAAFAFASEPEAAYTRVDRFGMPAVNTALITSKDSYNLATLKDDAGGMFVGEITSNLDAIHLKLNDDVTAAGLTPTDTAGSLSNAAAAIVPDTLKIDTTAAAGFPNGRQLPDRVIDITLSLILLQQSGGQNASTLANIPLNPGANDKAFGSTFPYLAAPF